MNLYGSNIQIWTQTKKKNAPKDQQTQNYKSRLKSNQETKIINKITTTWIWWQIRRNMTWQNTIGFKNQNDSNEHNMNQLKLQ